MTDRISAEDRKRIMSRVRNKNTEPEMAVRSLLHRLGFRFRIQRKNLPGTPDVVLSKFHSVIFVHGCYWHRHPGCPRTTTPATNVEFWREKFTANTSRDRKAQAALTKLGWKVLVIWECETRNEKTLEKTLKRFLVGGE